MSFDVKRKTILARRMFVIGSLKALAFGALFARTAKLQIADHSSYKKLSSSNKTRNAFIIPNRGEFIDKNDVKIAFSKRYYRLIFAPSKRKLKDINVIKKTAKVLNTDDKGLKEMLKRYRNSGGVSFVLYKFLTREELIKINYYLLYLEGVSVEESFLRFYKNPFAYSSLIGYIGEVNLNDDAVKLLNNSDLKDGKSGLEKHYNKTLSGIAGVKTIEVDSSNSPVSTYITQNAVEASAVKLSIDSRVQEKLYDITKEKMVSVCIIDIETNSVLASVSTPGFDSNLLSKQASSNEWWKLVNDPTKPLLNRPFSALYPPGSIFKIPIALSVMLAGFDPNTRFNCDGHIFYGGRKFNCWHTKGHGSLDMLGAIKNSCNVYFYKLSNQLDIDKISAFANKLGLGAVAYSDALASLNYKKGNIPTKDWKYKHRREDWHGGDNLNFVIGQGFNLVNCFQLCLMLARILSGRLIEPSFDLASSKKVHDFQATDIPSAAVDVIKKGMFLAANEAGGTCFGSHLVNNNNFVLSGKTGSAQAVSRFIDKHAKRSHNENTHGLFLGFAPFDNPKYAISVISEHGGFGSTAAAPIAKEIMTYINEITNL
jgi:penicillin-binding protein 2